MFLAIFSVILIYCLVYERHVSLLHILNLHVGEQGLSYEHVPASHTISTRNIFASRSHRIPPRCHRRYKKTDLSFPPTSNVHSFFFYLHLESTSSSQQMQQHCNRITPPGPNTHHLLLLPSLIAISIILPTILTTFIYARELYPPDPPTYARA